MKKNSWVSDLIWGILILLLGILFISVPSIFNTAFGIVVGTILIVAGVLWIIVSFVVPGFLVTSVFSILYGILAIVFGIIFISDEGFVNTLLPILFAIFLISNGVNKFSESQRLKTLGFDKWWITLVAAIIYLVGGILTCCFLYKMKDAVAISCGILLIGLSTSQFLEVYIKIRAKNFIKKEEKAIFGKGGFLNNAEVIDAEVVDEEDKK